MPREDYSPVIGGSQKQIFPIRDIRMFLKGLVICSPLVFFISDYHGRAFYALSSLATPLTHNPF